MNIMCYLPKDGFYIDFEVARVKFSAGGLAVSVFLHVFTAYFLSGSRVKIRPRRSRAVCFGRDIDASKAAAPGHRVPPVWPGKKREENKKKRVFYDGNNNKTNNNNNERVRNRSFAAQSSWPVTNRRDGRTDGRMLADRTRRDHGILLRQRPVAIEGLTDYYVLLNYFY